MIAGWKSQGRSERGQEKDPDGSKWGGWGRENGTRGVGFGCNWGRMWKDRIGLCFLEEDRSSSRGNSPQTRLTRCQ